MGRNKYEPWNYSAVDGVTSQPYNASLNGGLAQTGDYTQLAGSDLTNIFGGSNSPINNNDGISGAFTNEMGEFDFGNTMGTVGNFVGLAGQLQGMFGKNPAFEEQKRVNDANIKHLTRMDTNAETMANNQIARGAAERKKYNNGVDPLKNVG